MLLNTRVARLRPLFHVYTLRVLCITILVISAAILDDAQAADNRIFQAQSILKTLGYNPGPIDGLMGSKTRNAIKLYQKDNKLPQTGRLDKETTTSLGVTPNISENNNKYADSSLRDQVANSVGYVLRNTKTENPYAVMGIGKMQSVLRADGATISLVEPTIWIFASVPVELKTHVKENSAYFKNGDKWDLIRFVDPTLSPAEAASLFGVTSENTMLIIKSF